MVDKSKEPEREAKDILQDVKSYQCSDWVCTSAEKRYDIFKLLSHMYKLKKGYEVKKTAELFKPSRRHITSLLEHICNLKSSQHPGPKTEGTLNIDVLYDTETQERILNNLKTVLGFTL